MIRIPVLAFCCAAALATGVHATPQPTQNAAQAAPVLPSYVTVAGDVIGAPLIIDARIAAVTQIKSDQAPNLNAGRARLYVEADVLVLIRGSGALQTRIAYVVDVPLNARGKLPKLKKQRVVLFARPVAANPNQVQLTGIDSQLDWSADLDALVRSVTKDVLAADAPPAITGIGNAFHVPGSLPGEGETQVFLQTASGSPVSLQILRRPGEQTRWAVSLGDIVDNGAGPPKPATLLWYRLACGLPRELPVESLSSEEPGNAKSAREDYALVLRDLGPCT
jgi:hypothetical protein